MKNLTVFLVKTVVLFLVFWLLSTLTQGSNTVNSLPDWALWLILAAVASVFDYIIDVVLKPESQLAGYVQYKPNRA